MKSAYKWVILTTVTLSMTILPTISEAAYRCAWRNGHRVCWYTDGGWHNGWRKGWHRGKANCVWVKSHWSHGVFIEGHRVCR
jgi:hypothetical protein